MESATILTPPEFWSAASEILKFLCHSKPHTLVAMISPLADQFGFTFLYKAI